MTIPGLNKRRVAKPNFGQIVKALAKINGREVLPSVRMPTKGRGPDRGVRQQPERALRVQVIRELRRQGCRLWRIENSVYHHVGLPDILFFHPRRGMFFCELKSATGRLSDKQKLFKELCDKHGVRHIVPRSLEDLKNSLTE